jgi:Mrp family chromosome partitioning ATPase
MNEPLKNQDYPQKPEDTHSSLIQRAMQAFDRGQFVPPSGPADLVPPSLTPQAPAPQAYMPPVQAPVQPAAPVNPQAPVSRSLCPGAHRGSGPRRPSMARRFMASRPRPMPRNRRHPPAFHRINHQRLALEGFAVPGGAANAQVEEFRIVKRQLLEQIEDLRRQGAGVEAQSILITSALPEEGKTFVAINLAMSIAAEKDTEVVLVDLDMARSSVLSTLGLPGGRGWSTRLPTRASMCAIW